LIFTDIFSACSRDELEGHLFYLNSAVSCPDLFKAPAREQPTACADLSLRRFAMRLLWARSKHSSMHGQNDSSIADLKILKGTNLCLFDFRAMKLVIEKRLCFIRKCLWKKNKN